MLVENACEVALVADDIAHAKKRAAAGSPALGFEMAARARP